MATSSTSSSNSNNEVSQQYPYPSQVNASSFLSIKLFGKPNYALWREQMMCLLDSYDMLGFIDGTIKKPHENNGSKVKEDATAFDALYRQWKRSDTLVKGWIYGSLSEDVMGTVVGLQTANDVWNMLMINYTTPTAPAPVAVSPPNTTTRKKDFGDYVPLCRAIQNGDWEKAHEFFIEDEDALTDKLNIDGHRTVHVAIGNRENIWFLENLLEWINPESLPTLVNNKQQNALHYAAMLDNTLAAKMLVEKNPHLLFTVDYEKYLPIQKAIFNSHKTTYVYLLHVCKQYIGLSGNQNPFEGEKGVSLLHNTSLSGFLDIAYDLLKDYPELARTKVTTFKAPLWCIAKKWDAYLSGEQYNFYQRFVYSHLPIENDSIDNTYSKILQDIENQEKANHVKIGMNSSYVYPDVSTPWANYLPGTYNNPNIGNQETDTANLVCKESYLPSDVPETEKPETYESQVDTDKPETYESQVDTDNPETYKREANLGVYPPGIYPPGTYPLGVHPPGVHPPGAYPPGVNPPSIYPPGAHPPGVYPPGAYPPGVLPPGVNPPDIYPPGAHPPGFYSPPVVHHPGVTPPGFSSPADYPGPFPDIENQETYWPNYVTKSKKGCVPQVMERIYVKFWKIALLHVPHIKQLHEDKVKHNIARMILKFICEEVGKLKSDHDGHYDDAFIVAVKNNTPEVIEQITRIFPQSIWTRNHGFSLSQLSIMNRCENIYNFWVHEVTHDKYLHNVCFDQDENNLLHLAGKLAPQDKLNMVTGAALQMQRELQWFEEVRKLVRPKDREAKNRKQETPIMVFRKEHKDLRQKGEEWMKKTADSYTITAALIITIVFAAAITVPGGNNGETGKVIFETKPSFIIFAISDAISLFTSTTSLLLFLSILTARYAEEDFLYKLPKRLILGLVMLFMSVTTMLIAFSATLYIMFGQEKSWILIAIAAITCFPIASFVTLQLPLLVDLISSTYGRGIFHKQSELRITS